MNKLKVRHWALSSHGALQGKTTFIAANCRAPIIVVDTDGRFDAVEALVDGEVFYLSQVINPLTLAEEIMELCASNEIGSIAFDSLTKLYSIHARMAYMRNIQGRGGKSRAAEMVHKSNAMTIARDMAMLGTDMYYTWHTTEGVDGGGKSEIRAMISDVERNRLQTSINVTMDFLEVDGLYGARIQNARDFGGRRANTGFTIWDKPGNYWRGAADWLEELMYTSFTGKPEALSWVAKELKIEIDEAEGVYDHVKESIQPETSALMWINLIMRVRDLQKGDTGEQEGDTASDTSSASDPELGTYPPEGLIESPPPGVENEKTEEIGVSDDAQISDTETPEAEKDASPEGDTGDTEDQDDAAEAVGRPQSQLEKTRIHIAEIAEKRGDSTVLLGQVAYAVLEAKPGKYANAEAVIEYLTEYPELPDDYTWELDKIVTLGGGLKFFDFAIVA